MQALYKGYVLRDEYKRPCLEDHMNTAAAGLGGQANTVALSWKLRWIMVLPLDAVSV